MHPPLVSPLQVAVAMEDQKVVDNKVVSRCLAWAFFLAWSVAVATVCILVFANTSISCSQNQCPNLTPAQGVEVDTYGYGFLWLNVPQGAAATVGLLLPRRHARSRWFLALVAVVSATVAHYMMGRLALIVIAANPGDIRILGGGGVVVHLAGDLLGLISLLVKGPE
ncbi:hypothetical protein EJB05_29601, partial [Eragrostis curvula]